NEDYHISSSDISALDAGTDLSADANLAFATDIDGDTRSTWDIGADEYVASVSSAAGSFSAYKQSIPPPVISNVTVDVEGDKAIVKWKTDKPAISEVYWSDKFYWLNRVEIERSFKTNHSVVLKVNIEKDTKYYFKVRSTDNYNTGFDYKLYSFVIPEKIESEDLSELDLETLPEQKEIDNSEARVSSIDDLKVSHSLDSNLALDLKWSDSNEVSLVESYSIFKNGSFLLKTNSPSFTDSNILPSSYYSYYVVVNGNNNTKSNSSNVVGIMSTDKITGNGIVGVRETEISGIESIKTLLQKQIDSLFFLIERLKILLEG
ncbi:hypothetical protein KKC45_02710, partial [Patescibacteria group bacterium]|nr:hypothetical protein [Patescibacteria group bacterium]